MTRKIDMDDPKISWSMEMVKNNPFMQWNRIEVLELDEEHCLSCVEIQPEQLNPNGLAHGGFLFTISDATASALARADGRNYSTLSADIHYLRNVTGGRLYGEASLIRRGRTTVVINNMIRGEDGKELAHVVITMFCTGTVVGQERNQTEK